MNNILLRKSGFNLIDKRWGGLYEGGSYLVIGSRKSGRTLLGLQYAQASVNQGEICVYFTNMRPKDLMIQAASIGFDIQKNMDSNSIIVVRVATPEDIYQHTNSDEILVEYLNDIITIINQYHPQRLIFDELTTFVGFRSNELLKSSFIHLLESIEDKDITSMYIVAEPATKKTNEIVDILANLVTGVVYLKKSTKKIENQFFGGTAIITPNVGHTEGQFSLQYKIMPKIGVSVDIEDEIKNQIVEENSQLEPEVNSFKSYDSFEAVPVKKQIEEKIIEKRKFVENPPNLYTYNDFTLIINNQIALFKSAGQKFNLISFNVSKSIFEITNVSLSDIKNAIIQSTNRTEKICYIDDLIMVLIPNSNEQKVADFFVLFGKSLKEVGLDEKKFNLVLSMFNYEVDENLDRAETILDYLTSPTTSENLYLPFNDLLHQ